MRSTRSWVFAAVATLAPVLASAEEPPGTSPAPAGSSGPGAQSSEARIEQLEQQVRILQRQRELDVERADEARKKGVTVTAAPGRGLTVSTNDNRFALTLRGRAQIRDTIATTPGKPTTNELNLKTARLVLQGHLLTTDLRYLVQLAFGTNDFESGNASPIFDAFLEYTRLRDLNIRVGQFFVPFDRARTIREYALQMVDRQLVDHP